jgi:hemerythrin superfamily protein
MGMPKKPADAVSLLKADHRKVEKLFEKFEKARDSGRKEALVGEICSELCLHALLEEEIFYPACQAEIDDEGIVDESYVEHDSAKVLVAELIESSTSADEFFDAKVSVLSEEIKHHVKEEEKRGEGVFAQAKACGMDLDALGKRLLARKEELLEKFKSEGLPTLQTRSFTGHKLKQSTPIVPASSR